MPSQFISRGLLAALMIVAALFAAPMSFGQSKAPAPSDPASTAPAEPIAQPDAAAKQPNPSRTAEAIAPLKEAIDRMEELLRRDDLTDAQLIENRGSIEPVRDELREIIASLEGWLADVDTRLKQLGNPPEDGEPKEDANLVVERTRLKERHAALDGTLKQARVLALRVESISERITERRRALFTQELLGRTSSALDPSFWAQAAKAAPDGLRGAVLLVQGWMDHVRAATTVGTVVAASFALLAFLICVGLILRWLGQHDFRPRELGTRFAKSFFAMISLMRIAITAPAIVAGAILILNAFGLVPERMIHIAFSLAVAVGIAAFGRGVAFGLFAPDDPERRLLVIHDDTARLISSKLVWAARVLGVVVFINVLLRAVIAPVSLTIATSAIFSVVIAGILCHFLFIVGRSHEQDDEVGGAGWLRAGGWLLVIGIAAALVTGFIGLAAFLAGRFLTALGLIGALYIFLVFIDALFTEVLTASTPRGRAVANFFGLRPRSIELIGTLLSAAIRLILILVVLLPLLGPWGIFAADFFGVVRDATFGFRIGDVTISLSTIFGAFATIVIGILATRAVQRWLQTSFLPRTALDPSLQHSISTIFSYLGIIAAISFALAQLGVDFQKITLVAGALSIGIGFGLQSVVSNFVSGLILLAERPIRVGDIINVKGEEGRVRYIHVRATEIETGDRASVIIPNSELITQVVKNRTHIDTFARVSVPIGVAYDSDVAKVRDTLMQIAKDHPHVMQSPAPTVFLTGFGDSAINFELGWLVRNIGDAAGVKSDICFSILEKFREQGIDIPYPRRDIRIHGINDAEPEAGTGPEMSEPAAPKKPKRK
ncbi:DUF3772 domain-containing protein [Pseudorhodoplanes sinuspersici]|uniref:Uncharacterized protein n=1 Tax=Pseudorhodoplanes sinuspersici TaxID=1235591 RepID=A0A1W6ZNW5_9HYPH|nr:DUF3772 domain-containing protein [Pseudorhodoplanes sinuspersici]ARP98474.1 hypothetical protein CAK95_04745 [Pseudorhodoplanes sinuspersici]RKE66149.1 small-conductance mechanosensitive channel [Pseudorhodoplanes sinuspersici]